MQAMPRPPSENVFQVAFKIPEQWVEMADEIAASMSRPAVTMTRTDALRAALWHGLNELRSRRLPTAVFALDRDKLQLLEVIQRGEKITAENSAAGTPVENQDPITIDGWLSTFYEPEHRGWLRRSLIALKNNGYVVKKRVRGYVLTPKGREALQPAESKPSDPEALG